MASKNPNQRREKVDLIDTAERRAFVLDLKKSGATYRQIAAAAVKKFGSDRLPSGWDALYASKDVKRVLKKLHSEIQEDMLEIRQLELERLDSLFIEMYHQAKKGVMGAVDRCLRIMERRAKLLGLDAPQKISVDWRKEMEEAGIPASEAFEEMVKRFVVELEKKDGGDHG